MINNYFTLAWRNLLKHKSSFLINLIGLSIGLACVLFIYLWVNDELKFDKYHEKDGTLYQVMYHTKSERGVETRQDTPHPLSEALAKEMPEVEYAVTVTPDLFLPAFTLTGNNKTVKGLGKFVGKDFFNIFSYNLVQGDKFKVLTNKNAIVLSESQAKNLFRSTDNIIGKTIKWDVAGLKRECLVTGIFKDVPLNSSEHFDFILSFDDLKDIMGMQPIWNAEPFITYLTVKKGINIDRFNDKVTAYVKEKSNDHNRSFFLKSFSDNYLYSKYENGKESGGRIEYVKLFSLIALFILIISSINFINLSTAKAAKRVKEVGIKKAIGAGRKVLIAQYLVESILISFLSLTVAVILVLFLLPQFNEITGKNLLFLLDTEIGLALLGITVFTGVLSGIYPAIYLSGFKPAMVLKGRFNSSTGELWTRKGLVIFQFTLSIIFIISVVVLYKQIDYVQHKSLGFDKNNLIYFEAEGTVSENPEAFLYEIQRIPGIEMAPSMIGNLIGDKFGRQGQIVWEGKRIPAYSFGINYGMIETLGIKIKEGRSFSKSFGSNNSQIILNEAAVEEMGLQNPIGTIIKGEGNNTEIIGVVKNFHFQSLHEKILPVKFRLDNHGPSTIVAKITKGKEKDAINNLENFYKEFNPKLPFIYKFLDEDSEALYASERQVSALSRYFAGLAILISCLGLFGLSAFTAERRRKEIGIRKVIGASNIAIIRLLSGEFTRIVLIAIVIAVPLSFLLMERWLNDFAYRIELEWWYFAGAGLSALVIAGLTVSVQAVKAAVMNPVKSLRSE